MTENEFLLQDRLAKIKSVIEKYGEENFYVSFSGGKDSTVLSALVDMAIPGNTIPRVYANTGIEYRMIVDFVERERERVHSWKLHIIKPSVPIKATLEKEGYPFKSKIHSRFVERYQKYGMMKSVKAYISHEWKGYNKQCPKKLMYQFTDEFALKVSHKCCVRMKENVLDAWAKENNKLIKILGIMIDEGGAREKAKCLAFVNNKLKSFQPLTPLTKEWEEWFVGKYNFDICDIYKPPYNFTRTGCKGCPFALGLQKELDTLEKFFPAERKQCEYIWKPVYEEYRRLNYRLKHEKWHQMTIEEYINESEY